MAGCLVGGPYVGWLDFFPFRQYRWSLSRKKVEGKIPHPDPEHGSLLGHPDVRGSRLSAVLCSGPKVKTGRLPAVSFLSLNSKHGTEHLWKLEFRVPMEHKPSSRPTAGHRPSHYFCPSPKYLRPSALCLSSSHYKLLALVTKKRPLVVNPDVRQGWKPCFNPRRNRCLYKDDPASNSFIGCFFDISLAGLWVNSKSLLILILISSNWDNNERISLFSISSVGKKNFLCFDRYATNLSLL